MNRNAVTTLALAAALAVGAGAAAAAQDRGSMTERDVHGILAAEGYTNIEDVEFDDGMWEAEARRNGRDLDLRIDPRTGAIYPEDAGTNLTANDIEASVAAAGYGRIHDIDFDDGLWKAEAYDSSGAEWDLYLDPRSAEIVGRERD